MGAATKGEAPPLSARRAGEISFKWESGRLHVDDRPWGPPKKPVVVKALPEPTQLHFYVLASQNDAQ
jgi:hypothetical protein